MLLNKLLFKDWNNLNAGAKGFPPYFRSVGNVDFYGPGRSEDGAEENQQCPNLRCWKVLCPDPSELKIENWKLKNPSPNPNPTKPWEVKV